MSTTSPGTPRKTTEKTTASVEEMLLVISLVSTEICQTSEASAVAAASAGALDCAAQPAQSRRSADISAMKRIVCFFKIRYLFV